MYKVAVLPCNICKNENSTSSHVVVIYSLFRTYLKWKHPQITRSFINISDFLFLFKTFIILIVIGTQKNRLNKAILMSTNNIQLQKACISIEQSQQNLTLYQTTNFGLPQFKSLQIKI